MRPEEELILCCARTSLDSERVERIKVLLNNKIDWDYVNQTALRHGVMPLLYINLKKTFSEAVPKTIMDQLREQFLANTGRNLFLTEKLLKILHLFEEHKIPAIPFKGPAIASSAYGDIALRQFSDLDILIKRQDVLRAMNLLVSLGYKPEFKLTGGREKAYLKNQYELVFSRHERKVVVELQWEVVPRYFNFSISSLRLWERIMKEDSAFPTLPSEDILLILCVHGTKHIWNQLMWVCDVAQLVRKELNWERVISQAGTMGSQRMLFLGLFLAENLLGASLPENVSNRIERDPVVPVLAEKVRQKLFQEPHDAPGLFESCLFHLKAREHLRDQVSYFVRFAVNTTPGDWTVVSLPPSLSFLYSLIRPIRLASKYGLQIMRSIYSTKQGKKADSKILSP